MAGVLKHLTTDDPAGVVYADEGRGPVVLVVHGGLSDESAWAKVAAELTPSFRVVRIRRRLYRTELPADPATDFAREVDDLLALAAEIGEPVVIVGHSSGAIVALETLARDSGPFRGWVVYEPPLVLDKPIGGATGVADARAALDRGRPGTALRIFITRMVGMPASRRVAHAADGAGERDDAVLRPTSDRRHRGDQPSREPARRIRLDPAAGPAADRRPDARPPA